MLLEENYIKQEEIFSLYLNVWDQIHSLLDQGQKLHSMYQTERALKIKVLKDKLLHKAFLSYCTKLPWNHPDKQVLISV